MTPRKLWVVAVAVLLLLVSTAYYARITGSEARTAPEATNVATRGDVASNGANKAVEEPRDAPPSAPAAVQLTEVPPLGTNARRRVLVRAKYGPGDGALGKDVPPGEGEVVPPQGFTPMSDGKLLVLDSAKKRLVWYDEAGQFERAMPLQGLTAPADVAVAQDGTIVVLDHAGPQTKGLVFLDPSGKTKAELPKLRGGGATGMYIVGDDVYLTARGLTSIKESDTSGAARDETPGLYDNDGEIPGHVAPDGRTVVSAGINDQQGGTFFVSSIVGEPPVQKFSRHFKMSGSGALLVPFIQSDAKGDIYTVLYEGREVKLVCLDGKTGDPVGAVALPAPAGTTHGTPFRTFSVVPSGGIIYQELSDSGSIYEWFDCH